jgi:hypothetical protein
MSKINPVALSSAAAALLDSFACAVSAAAAKAEGGTKTGVSASSNQSVPRATSCTMYSGRSLRSTLPDVPDV